MTPMKKNASMTLVLLLGLSTLITGCRGRYDVVVSGVGRLEGVSHPVLDKKTQVYTFTDYTGRQYRVPVSRITLIEPHVDQQKKIEYRN